MNTMEALNKLAKWRTVFASWQLGTRPKGDPECDAVRDHREATILLCAEVNALTAVLIENHIVSPEQWNDTVKKEALILDHQYEEKFPGFQTTLAGVQIDLSKATKTMKGWRP